MEIFELKYFLGVAEFENIHRAAEKLSVSTAALSKAITRLESELGVNLFAREGRRIVLTEAGRVLQRQGSEITRREESLRLMMRGGRGTIRVRLSAPEVLLGPFGIAVTDSIRRQNADAVFELVACTDREAIRRAVSGEAHLALITAEPPRDLISRRLAAVRFQTCVGTGHPLYRAAKTRRTVPIEEVLQHAFVTPSSPLFGRTGDHQSPDGWRDDQFPRRIGYVASGLTLIEELVAGGQALAYLPDYRVTRAGLAVLKISGCPYRCDQEIHLVTRDPEEAGWLKALFR